MSRGSVLFADFKGVYIYVNNSTFTQNYAYLGGVFYSHQSSFVEIENSIFSSNFGIQGGIGMVLNNGYFRIHNSSIMSNFAMKSAVAIIISGIDNLSTFSQTTFASNQLLSFAQFLLIKSAFNTVFA